VCVLSLMGVPTHNCPPQSPYETCPFLAELFCLLKCFKMLHRPGTRQHRGVSKRPDVADMRHHSRSAAGSCAHGGSGVRPIRRLIDFCYLYRPLKRSSPLLFFPASIPHHRASSAPLGASARSGRVGGVRSSRGVLHDASYRPRQAF